MDQCEGNPQSWNLYTYVRNNPLKYLDPTGEKTVWYDSQGRRIGDEFNVTINDADGTLTASDGTVYNLNDLNAEEEVRDQGTIGAPPTFDELALWDYVAKNIDENGTVPYPDNGNQITGLYVALADLRVDYRTLKPGDVVPPLPFEPGIPAGSLGRGFTSSFKYAVRALKADPKKASAALHAAKRAAGRGGADNVVFNLRNGDIVVEKTKEVIGNLLDY